ncbi:MAG: hypothetical protein ABL886_05535 [Rhodoglobus sp.]
MRRPIAPNKVEQDGPKAKLLCGRCEQLFGRREDLFAREFFHPWLDQRASPSHTTPDTHYFLVSLLWRNLEMYLRKTPAEAAPWLGPLTATHEAWRRYLTGDESWAGDETIHLFLLDVLDPRPLPVQNLNRYFATVLDSTVAVGTHGCLVYSKMGPFLAAGHVVGIDASLWENTLIPSAGGPFVTPQALRDTRITAFMIDRARASHEMYNAGLSDAQRLSIERRAAAGERLVRGSLLDRAIRADHAAEIDPNIGRSSKIGRNDRCPCGSGLKDKWCHGAPA